MTALKMSSHGVTGRRIVEVYDNDGQFVAAIYPDNEINGINIVSNHFEGETENVPGGAAPDYPAVRVRFRRRT